MPLLIHVEPRTETVARRAIGSGASMGVGVFIGALVVALLGLAGYYLWRRSQRDRRARTRRAGHIDPLNTYGSANAHPPEKDAMIISPFVGHHEEMMLQRPVLHITHSPPPSRGESRAGDMPASALDEQGRWTGRMPHTPNSADPLLGAVVASPRSAGLASPKSAGSGPPSGSGYAAGSSAPSGFGSVTGRTRTRTPPLALVLDNARLTTANAHVRQSVNGTVELTVSIPPPLPAPRATLPTTEGDASPSRHPYAAQTTPPLPASPPRAAVPSSNRGKRSSSGRNLPFFVQNRTSPSPPGTPAPRYSLWDRLSAISGGLLHTPPTALPAYRSPRPDQQDHRDLHAEAGPSGHERQDSGRFLPPVPPPNGPVPMPPSEKRRRR